MHYKLIVLANIWLIEAQLWELLIFSKIVSSSGFISTSSWTKAVEHLNRLQKNCPIGSAKNAFMSAVFPLTKRFLKGPKICFLYLQNCFGVFFENFVDEIKTSTLNIVKSQSVWSPSYYMNFYTYSTHFSGDQWCFPTARSLPSNSSMTLCRSSRKIFFTTASFLIRVPVPVVFDSSWFLVISSSATRDLEHSPFIYCWILVSKVSTSSPSGSPSLKSSSEMLKESVASWA